MKLPTNKLYHDVTSTGELNGIALDVFEIVAVSPGLTAGEIFLRYQNKHPNTFRSRNEVAKRVSDLSNWGVIKAGGKSTCPTSGRIVNTWEVTGKKPKKKKAELVVVSPTWPRTPVATAPEALITGMAAPSRNVPSVAQSKNVSTLAALGTQCRLILRFRRFLPKGYVAKTEAVLAALNYAVSELSK